MNEKVQLQNMRVNAVICTCNRAERLRKTLIWLQNLKIPDTIKFELIIVDNNSTDQTEAVVKEFMCSGSLNVHYTKELQQGLGNARNRGIKEATGDYVVFWDDDEKPVEDYLMKLIYDLEKFPDIRAFGGKIIAVIQNKPDWFITEGPYKLKGFLGSYDLGETSRLLTPKDPEPIGGNMIFRKDIFEAHGMFRGEFGRRHGAKYVFGMEDTEFYQRIRKKGEPICYLSGSSVKNYMDTSRLSKDFVKKGCIGAGIGEAQMIAEAKKIQYIFGVPRYLIRRGIKLIIKIVWHRLIGNSHAFFYYRTRFWILRGTIMGIRNKESIFT